MSKKRKHLLCAHPYNISTILLLMVVLNFFLLRTTVRHHPLPQLSIGMDCVSDKKRKNLALYIVGKGIPNYWVGRVKHGHYWTYKTLKLEPGFRSFTFLCLYSGIHSLLLLNFIIWKKKKKSVLFSSWKLNFIFWVVKTLH